MTKAWVGVQATTVALCAACHKHVEAHQGRTRARGLPFPLTLQPDAYNKRAGRCSCGAPKCVAEEW